MWCHNHTHLVSHHQENTANSVPALSMGTLQMEEHAHVRCLCHYFDFGAGKCFLSPPFKLSSSFPPPFPLPFPSPFPSLPSLPLFPSPPHLSACDCNGYNPTCDSQNGSCQCLDSGVTGNHCDRCDAANLFTGDANNFCHCE